MGTLLETHKCDSCDKLYFTEAEFKEHIKLVHGGEQSNSKCDFCEASFYLDEDLMNHILSQHSVTVKSENFE